jgi:hypothetical protein
MFPDSAQRLGSRVPVVRHFIACERIDRSPDRRQYSLVNVIHAIRPLPGASYPRIYSELVLFLMMTDGQGRHSFSCNSCFSTKTIQSFTRRRQSSGTLAPTRSWFTVGH